MDQTKIKDAPKAEVRKYTDDQLLKLTVFEMGTLGNADAKALRSLILSADKKRKASDPNAKGIMGDRAYEKQPMDEMVDALGSLISGKADDAPASYVKLPKDEAVELRKALVTVVRLGKKMVVKGHVFDLRFDQRGYGWAKLTENWRKNGPLGKDNEPTNQMQEFFDSYKDNPTVEIFKS